MPNVPCNPIARYYLRAIELSRAGINSPDLGGILEDTAQYTLEHVIPLNPSDTWNLSEEILLGYTKKLGNMTLLDPTKNLALGNKTFIEKCAIYKESPLLITQEITPYPEWGPKEIDVRQEAFAKEALKIWTI